MNVKYHLRCSVIAAGIKLLLLTSLIPGVKAQEVPAFNPDTMLSVVIDSVVVIKTAKAGLNQEDFINQILKDTSFYRAFRRMKAYDFTANNNIYSYDKKGKVRGSIYRKIQHRSKAPFFKILQEQKQGKLFKKNGEYLSKTFELFDHIFTNAYRSGYSEAVDGYQAKSKNDSYKDKLKTLIFEPGKPIQGVPLISGKTEIFTANMRQYYDYTFYSGTYLDSIPVYRFKVKLKSGLSKWTADGIMIKELTTIFDKRNFQILGRYIDMKLDNLAFEFDVQMNMEMTYVNDEILPLRVNYQGNWDVPFNKEDRSAFKVVHQNYRHQ